ncbi:LOW QUALITY PROTEIN: olfactory receptor 1J4-like [Puma concolor]|uniref:Olfactory receptor n=1 Tax=Puma concolor TaxID=9696 RepID=A0A6P6H3P1_PUMCO|nr:LOW QUALITY PROTEIN: olfactory receptor 1J4-like [Puma concolor]
MIACYDCHYCYLSSGTFPIFLRSKQTESCIRRENQSSKSEFLLLGLPIQPEQQAMFFTLFLGMYLIMVLGNLLIILLIRVDSRLHTPMYFFLSHLAFTDVSFSSVTIPKMLINMHTWDQSIPYASCVTQIYFFHIFGCIDNLLLAVMAYDRYMAICHPSHYTTIMREKLCIFILAGSWSLSCTSALCHTIHLAQLSFCADNTISHFFCELAALLKLSCSDTSLNEVFIFTVGGLVITLSFIGALVSYGRIGATILRFPSIKGIYKALATCGSHLSVVFLFCGTIMVLHFFPSSSNSNDKDIIASVMYIVVTPMLNPFIYSLRKRDIKGAMGQLLRKEILFSKVTVPYSCSYVIH